MAMPAYLTVVWLVSRLIETLLLVDWPIVSAYADILINSSKKWRKESCINFCNAIAYRLLSDTWSLWPNFPKYKKKKKLQFTGSISEAPQFCVTLMQDYKGNLE